MKVNSNPGYFFKISTVVSRISFKTVTVLMATVGVLIIVIVSGMISGILPVLATKILAATGIALCCVCFFCEGVLFERGRCVVDENDRLFSIAELAAYMKKAYLKGYDAGYNDSLLGRRLIADNTLQSEFLTWLFQETDSQVSKSL